MNRPKSRGAVDSVVLAGTATLATIGTTAAFLLQAAGNIGMSTPDIIMIGLQTITIPAMIGLYFEIKAERKSRELEIRAARMDREDLAKHESEKRGEIHERLNTLLSSLAESAKREGIEQGKLIERVDIARQDLLVISTRLDGIGSKASNQAEKAWETRSEDFDRRVERIERQLFDTPRNGDAH